MSRSSQTSKLTQIELEEQQTIQKFKKGIKEIASEDIINSKLFVYVIVSYIIYGSINQSGKILLADSYNNKNGKFRNDQAVYQTLGNISWLFFFLTTPLLIRYMPQLIIKLKFRVIVFVGSIGPQLFLLIPYYSEVCMCDYNINENCSDIKKICYEQTIYVISTVIASIGGLFYGLFMIGILYYLMNISNQKEKILFIGTFYCAQDNLPIFLFFYSYICLWISGPLIGAGIMYCAKFQIEKYYEYILILQAISSLLFLGIDEPVKQTRLQKIKKQLRSYETMKQKSSDKLSNNLLDKDIEQIQQDQIKQLNQKMGNITIQYFSLEGDDLDKLMKGSFDMNQDGVKQDIFDSLSYYQKLNETWGILNKKKIILLIPSLLVVCFIQASILLYLYKFMYEEQATDFTSFIQKDSNTFKHDCGINVTLEQYKDYDDTQKNETMTQILNCVQKYSLIETFRIYAYYGGGQLIGFFMIGVMGDLKDKIKMIVFFLLLLQMGLGICWFNAIEQSSFYYSSILIGMILGFCENGIIVSLVSIIAIEYLFQIYMFDLLFLIYNILLAIASLILIIANFEFSKLSIIYLEFLGVLSMICLYFYFRQFKQREK